MGGPPKVYVYTGRHGELEDDIFKWRALCKFNCIAAQLPRLRRGYRGYIGIMEKKMETTGIGAIVG